MNKTKISSKVKSLALLCLYTTIGLGGATIVSSCSSKEDSTNKIVGPHPSDGKDKTVLKQLFPVYADQLENSVPKKDYNESIAAAKNAETKAKEASDQLVETKQAAAKYKKDAYVRYIMNVLTNLDKEISFSVVENDLLPYNNNKIDLNFRQANVVNSILSAINNYLTEEKGDDVNEDKLFDDAYTAFDKLLHETYLIQNYNNINYTNGFVIFFDKTKSTLPGHGLLCTEVDVVNMQDANGNAVDKIAAPLLICGNAQVQQSQQDRDDHITVVPTHGPKDMLKTKFQNLLKGQKEGK